MPLGDSITAGTDQHASYRCLLYQALTAAGYNVDFVGSVHGQWGVKSAKNTAPPGYCGMVDLDHEGHSGWAIYHILAGVPDSWDGNLASWVAANPPDVALVHLGALANIEAGPAALFFGAVVVITMIAAMTFDPRLIWDTPQQVPAALGSPQE